MADGYNEGGSMSGELEPPWLKYRRLAWIAGSVVIGDQITKWIILDRLDLYHAIPVVPGFFNITHVQNPGGAFGFLAQQSPLIRGIVFLLMSFLAVCLIFWLYRNTPPTHRLLAVGFALIFGGKRDAAARDAWHHSHRISGQMSTHELSA